MDYDPDYIKVILNPYQHFLPLNAQRKEIRLAIIKPGRTSDPIQVSLRRCSLVDGLASFDALSYCWGSLDEIETILVDHVEEYYGEPHCASCPQHGFRITQSLAGAIRRLRSECSARTMWIDALCINQGDPRERSQQVQVMREIYSSADSTCIWLGDESEADLGAALLIQSLPKGSSGEPDSDHVPFMPAGELPQPLPIIKFNYPNALVGEEPNVMAYYVTHLSAFFSRQWFRRRWVLQEVAASRRPRVHYGDMSFSWDNVLTAAQMLQHNTIVLFEYTVQKFPERAEGHLPRLWVEMRDIGYPCRLPMSRLLLLSKEFCSSDPRDGLFSLLGLADETDTTRGSEFKFEPDYRRSRYDIFRHFTADWIRYSGNLDILSAVEVELECRDQILSDLTLPSWAISFEGDSTFNRRLAANPHYNASGETFATPFNHNIDHILSLEGVRIDTFARFSCGLFIDRTGKKFCINLPQASPKTVRPPENALIDLWDRLASHATNYGDNNLQAYALTLTGGWGVREGELTGAEEFVYPPSREDVRKTMSCFAACWKWYDPGLQSLGIKDQLLLHSWSDTSSDPSRFLRLARPMVFERSLFVTVGGYLGLGPFPVYPGDIVVVLWGGRTPYILRPTRSLAKASQSSSFSTSKKLPRFQFIGECYIHDLMEGSVLQQSRRRNIPSEMFHLV